MINQPYKSLTELLVGIHKNSPSQVDVAYGLLSDYKQFSDPNEITLTEVERFQNKLTEVSSLMYNSKDIEIGRRFYNSVHNTYSRFLSSEGKLSNKKAKSLRRIEKEKLETLIYKNREYN